MRSEQSPHWTEPQQKGASWEVSPRTVRTTVADSSRSGPSGKSPGPDTLVSMDYSVAEVCGWRGDLETDSRGEFWIDREMLTQRMSKLSPTQRAFFKWGIVEEFSKGLEQILDHDQAVGEMREDLRDQ